MELLQALRPYGVWSASTVHVAHRDRVYFKEPHNRPKGPHSAPRSGDFFQPVSVSHPWAATRADEEEDVEDPTRSRAYVRNASSEQSMGAGAVPELEVPLPEDEDALMCPDKVTKVE